MGWPHIRFRALNGSQSRAVSRQQLTPNAPITYGGVKPRESIATAPSQSALEALTSRPHLRSFSFFLVLHALPGLVSRAQYTTVLACQSTSCNRISGPEEQSAVVSQHQHDVVYPVTADPAQAARVKTPAHPRVVPHVQLMVYLATAHHGYSTHAHGCGAHGHIQRRKLHARIRGLFPACSLWCIYLAMHHGHSIRTHGRSAHSHIQRKLHAQRRPRMRGLFPTCSSWCIS
ncbi:hypothetical protein B0H17DRAFT_1192047 [Mycena rosella]|uniref:Uncharacterized protein n=1 Tax=Mycena rosella TaxID=1033263 RepID=A0AAD7GXM6_MYCRO|nr:hypothetical protein B0H17DRAFT_1192047 [Mycena rosella]